MRDGRTDTGEIYDDLQRRLVTGRFAPSAKLMPSALQHDYGCSANTVRDVLLQLSKVGLVDFEMQKGFRNRAVSRKRRADLARFRVLIESEGAVESMRNGGLAWETRLIAAHHALSHIESQIARSTDSSPFVGYWSDAEQTFHETLVSECRMPLLIETFRTVYMQFRQQIFGLQPTYAPTYFQPVIAEHQAILDAALSGEPERMRAAVSAHQARHLSSAAIGTEEPSR